MVNIDIDFSNLSHFSNQSLLAYESRLYSREALRLSARRPADQIWEAIQALWVDPELGGLINLLISVGAPRQPHTLILKCLRFNLNGNDPIPTPEFLRLNRNQFIPCRMPSFCFR